MPTAEKLVFTVVGSAKNNTITADVQLLATTINGRKQLDSYIAQHGEARYLALASWTTYAVMAGRISGT